MSIISIITINYNNAVGLKKTIDSVCSQSFQDFEFIVIDGNSTDNSIHVIKQNNRINYWVSEKDNGIYDAHNKGINKATGNYLLFLNSGDILADNMILHKVASHFSTHKSFYYGNLILEKNNVLEKHIAPNSIDLDFMINSTFWHPCVFIKSELFKSYGLYNTEFKIAGDYEFFIRCLLKPNISTEYINEFITIFDGNGISSDIKNNEIQAKERENAWKLNISDSIYQSLKQQNAYSRSKFSAIINSIQKLRGKQNF